MCKKEKINKETNRPDVKAFWSCPLNPVAHGLTVTILFLLKNTNPKTERNINIDPPTTIPDHIRTLWCFNLLGIIKLPGDKEGAKSGFISGGVLSGSFGKRANGGNIGDGDGADVDGDGDGTGDMEGDVANGGNAIDETGWRDGDGDEDGGICNSFLSVITFLWKTK